MGGIPVRDKHYHLADAGNLRVHVFHVAERLGDTRLERSLVDKVLREHLAVLVRHNLEPALAHDGVVHVVELRTLADGAGLVELDFYAGAISHPGDFPDGAHVVPADNHRVFGLQRAEFVKIDVCLVGHVLVCHDHFVGDARKEGEERQERKVAYNPVGLNHVRKFNKKRNLGLLE